MTGVAAYGGLGIIAGEGMDKNTNKIDKPFSFNVGDCISTKEPSCGMDYLIRILMKLEDIEEVIQR